MTEAGLAYNVTEISGLKELWEETLGDPQITIAVLDGPVDLSHPIFATANLTKIETLTSGVADQGPASNHGTHITSVIFGQHDGPIRGIAPKCRGLIIPVFTDGANGSIIPCSQIDLARAISQVVQEGAHVINISGGELTPTGIAHPLLAETVRDCATKGILIVSAAGNQGCECLHVPGALPSVLVVGAMDANGTPLDFSNWGKQYQEQGILAPGENILGAIPSSDMGVNSGTSYATPIVTGIVALLLALQLKLGQKPDPHIVRAAILNSAIGCDELPIPNCNRLLVGRLNLKGALTLITKKRGDKMANSTERTKNFQALVDENVEQKMPETEEPMARVQAFIDDDDDSELTDSGSRRIEVGSSESDPSETKENNAQVKPSDVNASGCGCGDHTTKQSVLFIGQLGYDFGMEARRDSILQHMQQPTKTQISINPHDPAQLLVYLEENPWEADSIIWTLNFDATPIYAIKPRDAFALEVYQRLRQFLREQTKGEVERISVGGIIYGRIRLFTGQVVPVICPNIRCMYSWNTAALTDAVSETSPGAPRGTKKRKSTNGKRETVRNFLERVYHELRNLGVDPRHRAINYSATNALNIANIFESALQDNMQLDTIDCDRSPICRADSDCWDVKLLFFDAENQLTRARKVYRFTVDVSDVCPVMVGPVRSWFVR